MKRDLLSQLLLPAVIFLVLAPFSDAKAQRRDLSFSVGMNVPMYRGVESDVTLGLDYGQFRSDGLGFRTGLRWTPSVADVDHAFGVPLAFAWRTPARSTTKRLQSGAAGAAGALSYDLGRTGRPATGSIFGSFLMNLFSDMELFAGITPGYVAGGSGGISSSFWGGQYWEERWTEKTRDFSLMLDAGLCLNYSIWRFDIKLSPAFHYNLTGNYLYHSRSGQTGGDAVSLRQTPLRWFFSLSGGLAFRF